MPLTLRVFGTRARALAGRASHVFGPEGGRIGRAPDNDWVLPDPERYVSSHHARVVFADGRYNLLDTSSNGTFVNGAKEALGRQGVHPLASGDRIAIGGYEVLVAIGTRSEEDLDAVLSNTSPPTDLSASVPDLGEDFDLGKLLSRPAASASEAATFPTEATDAAIQAFQRGIGIGLTDPEDAQRILGLAGLLLREMTTGLVAFARERRTRQDNLTEMKTGRFDLRRDPLGQSGSVDEALGLMLGDEQRRLIPAVEAVRSAFGAVEAERRTSIEAAQLAVATVLARMAPEAIEQRFGAATDDAKAAHCWRQFCALHARLVGSDGLPTTWADDYEAALKRLTDTNS
jgi:predicted component of type VI protein secretion system